MDDGTNYGVSLSNSDLSLQTKPIEEGAQTVRSAPRGEGGVVMSYDGYNQSGAKEVCHTLRTASGGEGDDRTAKVAIQDSMRYIVRRLTPLETERLMGYPEGYTIPKVKITDEVVEEFIQIHEDYDKLTKDKPAKRKTPAYIRKWLERISNPETCPDAPRYKACGNGWAINCARWILQGITRYLTKHKE